MEPFWYVRWRRGRISAAERGELSPSFQIASARPSLTAALRDIGTLIMLASSMMARRALFLLSELPFSIFFSIWYVNERDSAKLNDMVLFFFEK